MTAQQTEKTKVTDEKKQQAYQLASAIYQWVLSDDAKMKPLIVSNVTVKPTLRQAIVQGFAFGLGIGMYFALSQGTALFINWVAKLLHL